jgi:hypothetical protein
MSNLSITAANVVKGTNAVTENGTAGETITAGQALYKSSTTNKWMKADANGASAEIRGATGIALTGSALNQPIVVLKSGQVTIGATLIAGVAYYLSDTAGGICPVADVGTGEYVCLVGLALSTTVLDVAFKYTGVSN